MTIARKRSAQEDDFQMFDFTSVRRSMTGTIGEEASFASDKTNPSLRTVSPTPIHHVEEFGFCSGFPPTIKRLEFPSSARGELRNNKRHRSLETAAVQSNTRLMIQPNRQDFSVEGKSHSGSKVDNAESLPTLTPPSAPWWMACPSIKDSDGFVNDKMQLGGKCEICLHQPTKMIEKQVDVRNMKQCSILSFMKGPDCLPHVCSPETACETSTTSFSKHCTHCDRLACDDCCDECVSCLRTFCNGCSIINYESSWEDRTFCLECHEQRDSSSAYSVGDCERMDVD